MILRDLVEIIYKNIIHCETSSKIACTRDFLYKGFWIINKTKEFKEKEGR